MFKLKLWKENKLNQEWELSNEEIAERFCKSHSHNDITIKNLIYFITTKEGLNSSFDFDEKKGSIEGSKDIKEIWNKVNDIIEDK